MATLPRALIVSVLLVPLMACRFSPTHRQAIVRFAVSAILDLASTDAAVRPITPAHEISRCPRPTTAARAELPTVRTADAGQKPAARSAAIPVRNYEIAAAALRPAADECQTVRRMLRIDLARSLTDRNVLQLERAQKQIVRCHEAELRAAEVIEQELRAAHMLPLAADNACLADPDAASVPVLDMRVHRTVGG